VPYVGRRNPMPGQQFRLEREDAQDMVGAAPDFLHALGAPGPDRGAYKVHRFDARSAQVC
jgi:hypothetical protein